MLRCLSWNRFLATVTVTIAAVLLMLPVGRPAGAENGRERIDPFVEDILRRTCGSLADAREFSFTAQVTYDEVLTSGQKLQFGGSVKSAVRRPDRIRTSWNGDLDSSVLWFDGAALTMYEPSLNVYATAPAPGPVDSLLDFMVQRLGFSLPLSDFYYSDPFPGLVDRVLEAFYVGKDRVDDASCHHLAMTQEDIDWQVWIEEGERPLLRKITITYKKLPGAPQYTAILSNWNFNPDLSEDFFSFQPPEGAEKIEFISTLSEREEQRGERP